MRTKQEITQEYTNLCIQSGEKSFQIKHLERDIRLIHSRCKKLNSEMQAILDSEKAAAEVKNESTTPTDAN